MERHRRVALRRPCDTAAAAAAELLLLLLLPQRTLQLPLHAERNPAADGAALTPLRGREHPVAAEEQVAWCERDRIVLAG
jgi:hypothetical protein